jgi:hypothetical protein
MTLESQNTYGQLLVDAVVLVDVEVVVVERLPKLKVGSILSFRYWSVIRKKKI